MRMRDLYVKAIAHIKLTSLPNGEGKVLKSNSSPLMNQVRQLVDKSVLIWLRLSHAAFSIFSSLPFFLRRDEL